MKRLLVQYAQYNCWANKQLTNAVINLTDEQLNRPIPSSFPSIAQTITHMYDVESIWWQRVKLKEHVEIPSHSFNGTILELVKLWENQSCQWKEWIDISMPAALEHEFSYMNSKKQRYKQPVYEMLMHLFNHQTYHRGQLVTMLRQVGCKKIPPTDLIVFLRK